MMRYFFFRGNVYNEAHVVSVQSHYDGRRDKESIELQLSAGDPVVIGDATVDQFLESLRVSGEPRVNLPAPPVVVEKEWYSPDEKPDLGDKVLVAYRAGENPWDWDYTAHVFTGVWPDSVSFAGSFTWQRLSTPKGS